MFFLFLDADHRESLHNGYVSLRFKGFHQTEVSGSAAPGGDNLKASFGLLSSHFYE